MTVNWNTCPAVHSRPEVLGGTLVFCGTRVPVYLLFEYLQSGDTTIEFVDCFSTVALDQVQEVLSHLSQDLRGLVDGEAPGPR